MFPEQMRQLRGLVELFYPDGSELGDFSEVSAASLPGAAHHLLAHNRHMTVVLEAVHQSPVRVEVLASAGRGDFYWRRILLRRTVDQRVVEFAIVRIDFRQIDQVIRREIEEQGAPLGRILIEHDVSRSVALLALWRLEPSLKFRQELEIADSVEVYGRTAVIYCNGSPAIELLEIPTPVNVSA
jgi:chorismate-pyruvate lyase